VLSPLLFLLLYFSDLSDEVFSPFPALSGFSPPYVGYIVAEHAVYADDLVFFAISATCSMNFRLDLLRVYCERKKLVEVSFLQYRRIQASLGGLTY
jgi:hypothetical protein